MSKTNEDIITSIQIEKICDRLKYLLVKRLLCMEGLTIDERKEFIILKKKIKRIFNNYNLQ